MTDAGVEPAAFSSGERDIPSTWFYIIEKELSSFITIYHCFPINRPFNVRRKGRFTGTLTGKQPAAFSSVTEGRLVVMVFFLPSPQFSKGEMYKSGFFFQDFPLVLLAPPKKFGGWQLKLPVLSPTLRRPKCSSSPGCLMLPVFRRAKAFYPFLL